MQNQMKNWDLAPSLVVLNQFKLQGRHVEDSKLESRQLLLNPISEGSSNLRGRIVVGLA